tara:strand:- start:29 stop:694 length:666 start_codon:yes stop_codon:yes gene_type:complete
MKNILLIGNSGGVGSALNAAWHMRGDKVIGLSRQSDGFDITNEDTVERMLRTIKARFDIVFIATGGLETENSRPEKSLLDLGKGAFQEQFLLNAIGPALVLKHVPKLLHNDRATIIATLSARVGSIGDNRLGGWYSYRASKAALNQIIHSAAIELSRTHPKSICIALHPGTVRTSLTQKYVGKHPAVSPAEAANNLLKVMDSLRPEDTGLFFDWAGRRIDW